MAAIATNRVSAAPMFSAGRLTAGVARILSAIADVQQARRTHRALSQLSDRELSDIGLCRADIDHVAKGNRSF